MERHTVLSRPVMARYPSLAGISWSVVALAAVLPAAVRLQVVLLQEVPVGDWLVWGSGPAAIAAVVCLAVAWGLRVGLWQGVRRVLPAALVIAIGLGLVGLWHFPAANLKDGQVASEWRQLHPTLRWALWVARGADGGVVVTDIHRRSQDYDRMGLSEPQDSRHYAQPDGYVHAVDLRVSDAGAWRNWARQGLFLLMGVKAERHGGTADHLHVYLPQYQ